MGSQLSLAYEDDERMPSKKKKKKSDKRKKKKHKKKSGKYSDSSGSDSETVYPSDLKREEENRYGRYFTYIFSYPVVTLKLFINRPYLCFNFSLLCVHLLYIDHRPLN